MSGSWPAQDFPHLTDADWVIPPSKPTTHYNCIAWSVGQTNRNWWPDVWGVGAWFPNVPRPTVPTVADFITGYASIGYTQCNDGILEKGFEKIALYAKQGVFGALMATHAAYQLPNGNWTSKLGGFEDIEHYHLDSLNGPQYGTVVAFMCRPRQLRPFPPSYSPPSTS